MKPEIFSGILDVSLNDFVALDIRVVGLGSYLQRDKHRTIWVLLSFGFLRFVTFKTPSPGLQYATLFILINDFCTDRLGLAY